MSHKMNFSLLIFICSINAIAQIHAPPVDPAVAQLETVPLSIISSPPRIDDNNILRIEMRDGGRKWSESELQETTIRQSFQIWMECFDDPASRPDCNNCNEDLPPGVVVVESLTRDKCLPSPVDMQVAYNPHLSEELKTSRDAAICSCYRNGQAGVFGDYGFNLTLSNNPNAEREERERLRRNQNLVISRVLSKQAGNRLFAERLGTAFSAASYSRDENSAMLLSGIYAAGVGTAQRAMDEANADAAQSNVTRRGVSHSPTDGEEIRVATELANGRPLTLDDYTSARLIRERNYCLPYRHFLASKQFPDDQNFYDSLRDEKFKWKEWNYPQLMQDLRKASPGGDINRALQNDRSGNIRRMAARAKFLYDNPVIKNIFLARDTSDPVLNDQLTKTKSDLFNILRDIPKPQCTTSGCRRDSNWDNNAVAYRARMEGFMGGLGARTAARQGLSNGRSKLMDIAMESSRSNLVTSDQLIQDQRSAPASSRDWRFFCDNRDFQEQSRTSPEIQFALNFEGITGRRDFDDPENDVDYDQMNRHLCTENRRGQSGEKSFNTYLSEVCRGSTTGNCSVENRPILLGQFIKLFPTSVAHDDSQEIQAIVPFLGGGIAETRGPSERSLKIVNRISSDPRLASSSVRDIETSLNLPSEMRSSSVAMSTADVTPITSQRQTSSVQQTEAQVAQNAAQAQAQSQLNQLAGFTPVVDPVIIPLAQNTAVAPQAENSRTPAAQNDESSRALREEISSLREVMAKPQAEGGPKDSFETENLTKRLAALEKNLRDSRAQNENLRRSRDDDREGRSSVEEDEIAPEQISQSRRQPSSSATATTAQIAAVPTGGVQSGAVSGGGVSSPVSGAASVVAPSAVNAAVPGGKGISRTPASGSLSRFGVQETVDQNGITVAVTSGSIDYQGLRSSSENNVINETVSAEEFNEIAGNNQTALRRFLDQARSMPGEVVRLRLNSANRSMDIFVVKNGNEISIVQAPEDATRRAPASGSDREHKLEDLSNEFTTQASR